MVGKRIAAYLILFALVALALIALPARTGVAGSFKPWGSFSIANPTGGAVSDNTQSISFPDPDFNYEDGSMITLSPVDSYAAPGVTMPIGAGVGTLDAVTAISVAGNGCNNLLQPPDTHFNLWNASVNVNDTIPLTDLAWLLSATPPPDTNPANGLPDYLDKYPIFLNSMFDPDGSGPIPPMQPVARYAGHSTVAGMTVLIQFVVFDPGQFTQLAGAWGVLSQLGAELGQPSFVVLDNPVGGSEPTVSAIHDFCTPVFTSTTLFGTTTDNPATAGDDSGYTRGKNPASNTGVLGSGTQMARNYSQSERNADGDNFENDLDECPWTTDAAWNARQGGLQPGGDSDGDGLPDSCDPVPGTANTDQDADVYSNRQDNCPLVKNGSGAGQDNQAGSEPIGAADKGPTSDAVGDACDDSDNDGLEAGGGGTQGAGNCADGIDNGDGDGKIDGNDPECVPFMDKAEVAALHTPSDTWGSFPQQGSFWQGLTWAADCLDGVDADADGYCDALETTLGRAAVNTGPETICNEAACPDADGTPGAPPWATCDDDSDGYINDGCPVVGRQIESGVQCNNNTSEDHGVQPKDWVENNVGVAINDGCPPIGVPESLVIDRSITVNVSGHAAQPPTAYQSCTDGVDNDGDTKIDGADNDAKGCDPATYGADTDYDGLTTDNCPSVWNPEQTNTDGDSLGDACDPDTDGDGFNDTVEWWAGTDPLDNCTNLVTKHDAWPLDITMDKNVDVLGDVLKYRGHIGETVAATPSARRLDITGDGNVDVLGDVLKFRGNIGLTCT